MAKSKRKRAPKTVLKLPDLEQSKSAVLNSLTSASSKRSYDRAIREFIDWYCSEPRLAFNRTVVTRYRTLFGYLGVQDMRFIIANGAAAVKHRKVDRATFLQPYLEAMDALLLNDRESDFVARAKLQAANSLDRT